MFTIQDTTVNIKTVDRKAMIALANAVTANAEALKAIAMMGTPKGNIVGIQLSQAREEEV